MENKLEFKINNDRTLLLSQVDMDTEVSVDFAESDGTVVEKDSCKIPAGDMVMLINLYRYIKRNDIQNDFINPCGKGKD